MNFSSGRRCNTTVRYLSHSACARMSFLAAALITAPAAFGALSATPSTITLSCTTNGGPGTAVNIAVKPTPLLTGSTTIAVTLGTLPAGIIAVTTPSNQTLSTANQAAGIIYTLNYRPGCVGATAGTGPVTFRTRAAGVDDATVTVNSTVTAATSALTPTPSAVTIVCIKNGSTYTPGAAKTVSVTSAATGGTPFTVDTVTNPAAAWLTVTPTTGGSAAVSGISFTLQAASGCGGFAVSTTNTTTVHLLNAPAPDKNIVVTLQVLPPTPITAAPVSPRLTYVKNSATPGYVDVTLTSASNPAPFFTVDTATLPIWLTVDFASGRTPKAIRFSSTTVSDTLPPGTYSASIAVKVSGSGDLLIPISILITNTAPRLTISEGITRNIPWTIGTAAPTPVITVVSTDSPISYTATTGGTLAPIIGATQRSGLAYSFGTQIGITFDPTLLASAAPGTVLTGTVTLSWGNPATTTVVTLNVTVLSPGATLSGISPASLPTAAGGQSFTVALSGTGFVASPDALIRTRVALVVGGLMVNDNNISWTVVNPSNILLTINVPVTTDPYLPFSPTGAGGSVTIGVCSPAGVTCATPSGTAVLTIGNGPILQVVTSASSFVQVSPGVTPSVAPYELVSIFGTNFCSSNSTGCSSNQILYASPDAALRYPTSLSPDNAGATQRSLKVRFQTQGSTPTVYDANILFATNNQINVIVPSGAAGSIGSPLDIVVSFGYGTGATLRSSTAFPVNIVATDPGIFTVGSNGQGQAAALLPADYSLVGANNEAGMRSTGSDSNIILLYLTGLGAPDSTADNASSGSSAWSGDCITPASYLTSLNAQTGGSLTSVDGVILQSGLLNTGRLAPCVLSNSANVPSVTIGGVAGTVSYAGWVADSMAGMYQINVKLPGTGGGPFTDIDGAAVSSITRPVQLPVVVTSASRASQVGVGLWVSPKLKVAAPTALSGTVGTAWASSNNLVVATQGATPYRFAVTSGLLPTGLTLNTTTGAISGTPAANTAGTYAVTVTATDSANFPIADSATFTLTIAGGLIVSTTGSAPFTRTFGASAATLTTATATGGLFPYTYAITAPGTLPAGMTVNATTGVLAATAATPAGTYNVTITATDSTSGTPLTGGATFAVVVGLAVTNTTPTAGTNGQVNANLTTVSATGNSGTVTYALDTTSGALGWLTVDSAGVVATTSGAVAGTRSVTVTVTDGTPSAPIAAAGTGTVTFSITIN